MKDKINKFLRNEKISFLKEYYPDILLFLVLFFAFFIRYLDTSKGLPYIHNWDEPRISSNALRIIKTGDFNPHFFHYGSLMIYLNLIVDIFCYFYLMSKPNIGIKSPKDIKIFIDTHWTWSISHPVFYHWNRILTALIAVLSIFILYKIVKIITNNKKMAVLAAFLVSIVRMHIALSAWATTDIPVSFFIILTIYFSLLYILKKEDKYLYFSLISTGLTAATKYNGALVFFIPFIAVLLTFWKDKKRIKNYIWPLLFLIPAFSFIVVMPYSLLDLPNFLKDVGYEIAHYKVWGSQIKPGIPNFIIQIKHFYYNLGLPIALISIFGLSALFKKGNHLLRLVFIYPIIYMYFMCNSKILYQRNFVQIYLFISILFAFGIYQIYNIFLYLALKIKIDKKKYQILFIIFLMTILFPKTLSSIKFVIREHNFKESRIKLISILNDIKGYNNVIIAKELRLHERELKKLNKKYKVVSILNIVKYKSKRTLYVLPGKLTLRFPKNHPRLSPILVKCKRLLKRIDRKFILREIGKKPTRLDAVLIDPIIFIFKQFPFKDYN